MTIYHRALKLIAEGIATILIGPWILYFHGTAVLFPGRRDQIMRGLSQSLSLLPGLTGSYLRCAYYRRTLIHCGRGCFIGFGTIFATADVSLGDRVYIGPFCNIGHVATGNDVLIGSNVTILSGQGQHGYARLDVPMNMQPGRYVTVNIGEDCWLGNGSIVMAEVAPHSIVAAGAVVTGEHPERSIVGGNPARLIRLRDGA